VTAPLPRPSTTPPGPGGADGGRRPERQATPRASRWAIDLAATIALATYSFIAALGFGRVFGDWEFVGDSLIIVIVGHGLSLVLRWLRVPGVIAVAVTLLALVWTVGFLHYGSTYTALFPTTETWDVGSADLSLVREQFRFAVAPVEYVGGWALLASVGTAFVVFTGDTFAFRANARGEALVPGAVLFVVVAALGADVSRMGFALALVASGFLAAVLLRARAAPQARTILGRARNPLSTVLPAAFAAGGLVVLAAWVIGPRLPGANDEPLVDTRNERGGVTEVISPLVDIRSRLVNRSATELFVVNATVPAYWRVTALPEFDGSTWRLPDRNLEDVDGALQPARPGSTENRQEIVIQALTGPLVPAAAEPVAASGQRLRWNAETSTLVKLDEQLATGDRLDIVSAMPVYTAQELQAATSRQPPDPIYLELPDNFPSSVAEQASLLTAGAPSPYDAAIALQNWFRSEFEYSIDVPQGHGNSAIEAFLRQRIGYCEQFAGTFAAMMRSLGIPSRVAVGYTQGLTQPDGSFSVLGRNSHAWPEVWFDQYGWVSFEPTPGRGAPGAEAHTGVTPAQDETVPGPGEGADGGTDEVLVPPTLPPPTIPPSDVVPDEAAPAAPPSFSPISVRVEGPQPAYVAILIFIVLLGAAALTPELVRRWRRRHPDPDVSKQVRDLWERALGAVEATGFRIDPSLTPVEQARAAAPRLPVAARPLKSLAALATEATFAPDQQVREISLSTVQGEPGPRRWARQVERIAADSMTASGRLRRYFTIWK